MKRLLLLALLVLASTIPLQAQTDALQNWCQTGNVKVSTSGLQSTTTVQQSYPKCKVEVFLTNTTTHATIYKDAISTPLANPFTANADGSWLFFAATGQGYDVTMSGGTPPNVFLIPFTLTDLKVGGGSGGAQTIVQVNSVATAPVSPVNFLDSTTVTWTLSGNQIKATAPSSGTQTVIKVNGTATTPTTPVNFNNTTPAAPSGNQNCTFQQDGAADVSCYVPNATAVPPAIRLTVTPPDTNQGIFIPFQTCTPTTSNSSITAKLVCDAVSGYGQTNPGGIFNHNVTLNFTYSNPTPLSTYGINPANVTAVYGMSWNANSGLALVNAQCVNTGTSLESPSPSQQANQGPLPGISGSNFGTVTCNFQMTQSVFGTYGYINIAQIGLWVEYTGTPATQPTFLNINDPRLQYLSFNNTLDIDPFQPTQLTAGLVANLPDANLSCPFGSTSGSGCNAYLVRDLSVTTGTCAGGGTLLGWCGSNGTSWQVVLNPGGGPGLPTATSAGQRIQSISASNIYTNTPQVFDSYSGDTLASIVAECGSNPCTYNVTQPFTYSLGGNYTLNSNIHVNFLAGGKWTINGVSDTFTFGGEVSGTVGTHLAGSAEVLFSRLNDRVPVEWFGAVNDSNANASTGTDNTTAIQNCINSLAAGVCILKAGYYKTTAVLSITSTSNPGVGLEGAPVWGFYLNAPCPTCTNIVTNSTTADILDITGASSSQLAINTRLKNIIFARGANWSGTTYGIKMTFSGGAQIENVSSWDSSRDWYFSGVNANGSGWIRNISGLYGYNGFTPTATSYCIYQNAVGNGGTLLVDGATCATNNLSSLTSYGWYTSGTYAADTIVNNLQTFQIGWGINLNDSGGGGFHWSDIQFTNSILDASYTGCAQINNVPSTDTPGIRIDGGWCNVQGSATYGFDIESSYFVQVKHFTYGSTTAAIPFRISGGGANTIDSNTINASTGANAVQIASSNNNVVTHNSLIWGTGTGILMTSATQSTIGGNTIIGSGSGSATGMSFDSASCANSALNNSFYSTYVTTPITDSCSSANNNWNTTVIMQIPELLATNLIGTGTRCLQTDSTGHVTATSSGCGGGGSPAFSSITSGTNTAAAMLVGSGASLGPTGTGTIQATNIASTITAGANVTITGSGTTASPYSIAASGSGGGGFAGTVTYTTNHTLASGDNGFIVIMNCSSACALTLPNPQPTAPMLFDVQSIGSSTATITLGSSMTYNSGASVPVLLKYDLLPIATDSGTATNYVGGTPPVAGSNVTITSAANGQTFAASGGGGSAPAAQYSKAEFAQLTSASVSSVVTPSFGINSGDLVIALTRTNTSGRTCTMSSTVTGTWTSLSGVSSAGGSMVLSYMTATSSSASATVTCTLSASDTFVGINAMDFTGGTFTFVNSASNTGGINVTGTTYNTSGKTINVLCATVASTAANFTPQQLGFAPAYIASQNGGIGATVATYACEASNGTTQGEVNVNGYIVQSTGGSPAAVMASWSY